VGSDGRKRSGRGKPGPESRVRLSKLEKTRNRPGTLSSSPHWIGHCVAQCYIKISGWKKREETKKLFGGATGRRKQGKKTV